jgi:hypothetical protein
MLPLVYQSLTLLRTYKARAEPLGKHLPDVDVDSRRAHVLRIRRPRSVMSFDTFPKMFR